MSRLAVVFSKSLPTYLVFSLALSTSFCALSASATKLDAPPLPHAKATGVSGDPDAANPKFSEGQEVQPGLSRFRRRPDYREEEAAKKEDAAKAAKDQETARAKAIDDQKKLQLQQIAAYKASIQAAADVNNRAVQFGKQGRWLEAIENHEKATQLDPRNKEFRINLSAARCAYGQQRLSQGDAQGAAHLFRQALAAAPDNGLAGKMLVEALKKAGINPSSPDARIQLGDQLAQANDLEGATIEYQQAMELEDSARTYVKMGDMYYRYNQAAAASQYYRQAAAKDPDFGPAHRQLGLLALAQRDTTTAAAELRKAVILDPKDTISSDTLVDIWRKQVATNPQSAQFHLGLASALQLSGDLVGAQSEYRTVQSIDPKNPQLEAAAGSLNRAYQHSLAEKHKLAAETLFNQGLRREALSEISQAVRLEPRSANYQLLLGECMESTGDYQGAHQAYLTCVLLDPGNNKEAAIRLKQMAQSAAMPDGTGSTSRAPSLPPAVAQSSMGSLDVNRASSSFTSPSATNTTPTKDMFEGGSGLGTVRMPTTTGLRTHDESAPSVASTASVSTPQVLPKVDDAESKKDFSGAATLLQDRIANDPSNADLHHRRAVDLTSAGNIAEAVSEFRMASAIDPKNKDYADDLARSLSIWRRSMTSDGGTGGETK
jgi:tetratricopeptide (TPR) repeat protein